MGTIVLVNSLKVAGVCGAAALVLSVVGLSALTSLFAMAMVSAIGGCVVSMFLPGFGE